MKSLSEYILEVVTSKELANEIEFEKASNVLTNKLIQQNGSMSELFGNIDGIEKVRIEYAFPSAAITERYAIKYKGEYIGVVGIVDGDKMVRYASQNSNNFVTEQIILLAYPYIKVEPDDSHLLSRSLLRKLERALDGTLYVAYLYLFKQKYQSLDLSPMATIKVVFDTIKETAEARHAKRIMAGGKDYRVTNLYCKVGGFHKNADKYPRTVEEYFRYKQLRNWYVEDTFYEFKDHGVVIDL